MEISHAIASKVAHRKLLLALIDNKDSEQKLDLPVLLTLKMEGRLVRDGANMVTRFDEQEAERIVSKLASDVPGLEINRLENKPEAIVVEGTAEIIAKAIENGGVAGAKFIREVESERAENGAAR